MLVDREIKRYSFFGDTPCRDVLKLIDENQKGIIFQVDEHNRVVGCVTDGDVRRHQISSQLNVAEPIPTQLINHEFAVCNVRDSKSEISKKLTQRIKILPLVDDFMHLKGIVSQGDNEFLIDKHLISKKSPTFIIAEIGNNHNGDIGLAKHLVDLAKDSGADCAKFQMRNMDALYAGNTANNPAEDLGAQYTKDLLSQFQLSNDELIEVFEYCEEIGVTPLCTPWDHKSLNVLECYGMAAYKVASADLTNLPLINSILNTKKPIICSTGMSTEQEISIVAERLRKDSFGYIFLHCNSTYPAPFKDIHLRYMSRLAEITDSFVGYSGHERGISVSIAAAALGAKVIEKHFTIDKNMLGNDHKVSLLPSEFSEMVKGIREVETALGTGSSRSMSQGEMINRETLAKSLVAVCSIDEGERIEENMIGIASPGQGLQPIYKEKLIGKTLTRSVAKGDYFYSSDLTGVKKRFKDFKFKRKYGIPVRFHDFTKLTKNRNMDIIEFHLSYNDLNLNINDYLIQNNELEFVVHCPELFANDHTLDLSTDDTGYRKTSIEHMRTVISKTKELKSYFPNTVKPLIVTNLGGFSNSDFLTQGEKSLRYQILSKTLQVLEDEEVEIIIQTMPPFPWHFGGQAFHNLFVDEDETIEFCLNNNTRICLDVSHTMMACNYLGKSFGKTIEKLAKYTAHMHIADAKGVDSEGVAMGLGDIDFKFLGQILNENCPNASFIPEVWQGHKNNGEGFWDALNYLEETDF